MNLIEIQNLIDVETPVADSDSFPQVRSSQISSVSIKPSWASYFSPSTESWGTHESKPKIQSQFEQSVAKALETAKFIDPFQAHVEIGTIIDSNQAKKWSIVL